MLGIWFIWGSIAWYYLGMACTIQPLGTWQANILETRRAVTKPLVPLERYKIELSNDISYTQIYALSRTPSAPSSILIPLYHSNQWSDHYETSHTCYNILLVLMYQLTAPEQLYSFRYSVFCSSTSIHTISSISAHHLPQITGSLLFHVCVLCLYPDRTLHPLSEHLIPYSTLISVQILVALLYQIRMLPCKTHTTIRQRQKRAFRHI